MPYGDVWCSQKSDSHCMNHWPFHLAGLVTVKHFCIMSCCYPLVSIWPQLAKSTTHQRDYTSHNTLHYWAMSLAFLLRYIIKTEVLILKFEKPNAMYYSWDNKRLK